MLSIADHQTSGISKFFGGLFGSKSASVATPEKIVSTLEPVYQFLDDQFAVLHDNCYDTVYRNFLHKLADRFYTVECC